MQPSFLSFLYWILIFFAYKKLPSTTCNIHDGRDFPYFPNTWNYSFVLIHIPYYYTPLSVYEHSINNFLPTKHPAVVFQIYSCQHSFRPKWQRQPTYNQFMVKHGDLLYLHHNFVCTLLNDLFGLQNRGGYQCTGPYSQRLLVAKSLRESSDPAIKPGFVWLSFPYFLLENDIKYTVKCLNFVGTHD